MGWNAYHEVRSCVPVEPASDRNLLKLTEYVLGCGYEGIGNHVVYNQLLYLDDVARCVTKAECTGIYK